jgi:hypothetical protein
MRIWRWVGLLTLVLAFAGALSASDDSEKDAQTVLKAVKRSTLNQQGTKPFHLKAALAPSLERDRDSGRTGEVEIWWVSPTQYRREVRSPEFHQIDIVNGDKEWQKNEGDYFPEWLREIAVALIDPVPPLDQVLQDVKEADVKKMMGTTYYSWTITSTDGNVQTSMGASVDVTDKTGLLSYAGGFGWNGAFKDFKSFYGRMVPRTVSSGTIEVTAKVITLEDLRSVPSGFFDAGASGGDSQLLRTALVEETALRKNMVPMESPGWPPLQDGPLEGAATTEIVVDRAGQVREIGSVVANNQGVYEVARKAFAAMRFTPYLENGTAVQVVSRISLPFKTVRPPGVETFDSAQTYFERGRRVSFPSSGTGTPYVLRADFQARGSSGIVEKGSYEDAWLSDSQWRREAWFGKSRYVRSRNGEKRYQLAEGPDSQLLKLVLKVMEPIPAIDTFTESDWKIKRDRVNGIQTVRVLAGYESPDGELDPEHARGYWFDETGKLVKTYFNGIETRRSEFEDFNGVEISHLVNITRNGSLGMSIRVTQVSPAGTMPKSTVELKGHEWIRAFTDEVR